MPDLDEGEKRDKRRPNTGRCKVIGYDHGRVG